MTPASRRTRTLLFPLAVTLAGAGALLPAGNSRAAVEEGMLEALATAPRSAKRALVVGAGGYPDTPEVPALKRPPAVARAIVVVLKEQFDFPPDQVTLVSDGPGGTMPTLQNIKTAAERFVRGTDDQSELVIFFSGHGFRREGDTDDYYLPVDGDVKRLKDTAYSTTKLLQAVQAQHPRRVLALFDACRTKLPGALVAKGINVFGTPPASASGTRLAAMYSCQPGEESFEDPSAQFSESIFTHFVTAGLEGQPAAVDPKMRQVTFQSLSAYVKAQVSSYVKERGDGRQQTPHSSPEEEPMALVSLDQLPVVRKTLFAAKTALEQGDLERARTGAESVLARDQRNDLALVIMASIHLRQGRRNDAKSIVEQLDDINPGAPGLAALRTALASGQVPQTPRTPTEFAAAGYQNLIQNDYLQAREAAQAAVDAQPENSRARAVLGNALIRLGQPQRGLAEIDRALQADPREPLGYVGRGVAAYLQAERLILRGRWDDARPLLERATAEHNRALEVDPRHILGHNELGVVNWLSFLAAADQKKPEAAEGYRREAERHYRASLAEDPNLSFAHTNLGQALMARPEKDAAKFRQAEEQFREALRISPRTPRVWAELAASLLGQGRKGDAMVAAQKAKDLGLRQYYIYKYLGM